MWIYVFMYFSAYVYTCFVLIEFADCSPIILPCIGKISISFLHRERGPPRVPPCNAFIIFFLIMYVMYV
jgi:hypothetical protein